MRIYFPQIKGRIADLSKANKYYRKCWEAVLPRVRGEVRDRGSHRYKLSARLYRHFLRHYREVKAYYLPGPKMKPVDFVAVALYRAALDLGLPESSYARQSKISELWPRGRSISAAWQRLGRTPSGISSRMTLEAPASGGELIPCGKDGHPENPKLGVTIRSTSDTNALPKLTIEIEGEPVCLLLKIMEEKWEPVSKRTAQRGAGRLWSSLVKWLSVLIGAQKPGPGRQADVLFEKAAMLHHLDGLTIRKVAERLCPREHKHDSGCQERFRKGIEQFFKRLRGTALRLPPVKS